MTDAQWINLLLQGGPVVPIVMGLWMLLSGRIVTAAARDREIVYLERIITDLKRDRDALANYTDRSYELADAAANFATRRALQRPPMPHAGGADDD